MSSDGAGGSPAVCWGTLIGPRAATDQSEIILSRVDYASDPKISDVWMTLIVQKNVCRISNHDE